MNERLAELHEDVAAAQALEDGGPDGAAGDVETGQIRTKRDSKKTTSRKRTLAIRGNNAGKGGKSHPSPRPERSTKKFFEVVERVKSDITAVEDATERIAKLRDGAVLSSGEGEEARIGDSIRTLVERTNTRAKHCKSLLVLLQEENAELKEGAGEADLRMRENLINALLRKFVDETSRYRNAQERYKSDLRAKVTHQVRMVEPDATDGDVDRIMRSEGGREALYRQLVLSGGASDEIKTKFQTVGGKYRDVLAIEASVAELHQMFLDLALLTELQGGILDDVEYHVKSAKDYTENANENLHEAIVIQKKIRRRNCWILLIVVMVIIIILVPML